ncbi:MAG: hypothetical protein M1325_03760 [Actinobacteria bacterium]|nr:hypothetical protein [Actinomycetota bacterium]
MFKTLQAKGAALIVTGALGLIGLGALGPVFDPGTASAEQSGTTAAPSWTQPTAQSTPAATDQSTTDQSTRDRILDMMRDHMGVTGDQAEKWADTMTDMMKSMHGDQADEMLQWCTENGGGMMGDWNKGTNGDSTPGNGQGSNWGGGMMGGSGGGMMGGWSN